METKKIRYIGRHQTKGDNITPSDVKWTHPGQVKLVPASVAARLLNHPDAWVEEGAPNDPGPDALYNVHDKSGRVRVCDSDGNPVAFGNNAAQPAPVQPVPPVAPQAEAAFNYANDPDTAIRQAIGELETDNDAHFTGEGLPRCEALEELLGYDVAAADRTRIWEEMQAEVPVSSGEVNGTDALPMDGF